MGRERNNIFMSIRHIILKYIYQVKYTSLKLLVQFGELYSFRFFFLVYFFAQKTIRNWDIQKYDIKSTN